MFTMTKHKNKFEAVQIKDRFLNFKVSSLEIKNSRIQNFIVTSRQGIQESDEIISLLAENDKR